jgi:kynurenine formamidase
MATLTGRPQAPPSLSRNPVNKQYPAQNATYNSGEPGIGTSAAKWLASQKVIAVGTDTWAVR